MFLHCHSLVKSLALITVLCASALYGSAVLRVCAAANNLPFSNRAGQGFENKLATLAAQSLNASLHYTWNANGKSALLNGTCDVLIATPQTTEDISTTAPYYRSSYVFVARADHKLALSSLLDPRLAQLQIGINIVGNDYAPPAWLLAHRGITQNIKPFALAESHEMLEAVDRGTIDTAILWGPVAGYYAKSAHHLLTLTPVSPNAFGGMPFAFSISMGVRKNDEALREDLDRVLSAHAGEIQALLNQYGIPQVR